VEELEDVICSCARRIRLPLGDIIKCEKMVGRTLPYPMPFLQDKEVCVATRFNLNLHGHIIGGSKVNVSKMYDCPNREGYRKNK
jgi:hypothetical protein